MGATPAPTTVGNVPDAGAAPMETVEEFTAPRTRWQSRSQFVLVMMGYCIGVGNLWRFPYLCGKNGGFAFVFAYFLALIFCAAPLFFYECVLGLKFQRGPVDTYRKMDPHWVGLAYIPVGMTLFFFPYYQVVVTWAFHYFINSFQYPLPWDGDHDTVEYFNKVTLDRTEAVIVNGTHVERALSVDGAWDLNWRMLFEVFVVFLITAVCLVKGIHSAGKAAYFTVITPVVLLFILFCTVISLDGAGDGLSFYLKPKWEELANIKVWGLAAGQIIFSLSPGMGCCIAMSSFHDRDYKGLFRDCVIVIISNSAFSLFGGFVVFSVVGHMAHIKGVPVADIAASGEGLAFIVFAEGITKFGTGGWTTFLSIMFFLTLFLLGLDSSFAVLETMMTYVNDYYQARNPGKKVDFRTNSVRLCIISTFFFLIAIPYSTKGGYYLLSIADHYSVTYSLTVVVFLEYVMIGHIYTAEQMLDDVYQYTNVRLPYWFAYQIKFVAPCIIFIVVLMLLISDIRGDDEDLGNHPAWARLCWGVFPTIICISLFFWPFVKFPLTRLFFGKIYPSLTSSSPSKEDVVKAKGRAEGPGYKDFRDEASSAQVPSNAQPDRA